MKVRAELTQAQAACMGDSRCLASSSQVQSTNHCAQRANKQSVQGQPNSRHWSQNKISPGDINDHNIVFK